MNVRILFLTLIVIINCHNVLHSDDFQGVKIEDAPRKKIVKHGESKHVLHQPSCHIVNLSEVVNRGFVDDIPFDGKGGWTDLGQDDAAGLASGKVDVKGVPFVILDPKLNNDKSAIVLAPINVTETLPHKVEISINRNANWIYFLHNIVSGFDQSGELVVFRVNYEDGSCEKTNFKTLQNFTRTDTLVSNNKIYPAVYFTNSLGGKRVLNLYEWENPRPEVKIKSIELHAREGFYVCVSISTAVGTSSVMPKKYPELPVWHKVKADWFQYRVPWGKEISEVIGKGDNPLDFSRFLDTPAGKHGFVKATPQGDFLFDDGTPARFWGGHLADWATAPNAEEAVDIANYLAFHGYNMVRLYNVNPKTMFRTPKDWDATDRMIYELRKRGIYYYFNLTFFARHYKEFEGSELELNSERFKLLASQILQHYNPYTKLRYADDPGMCFLELGNESDSTLRAFGWRKLLSEKGRKTTEYKWMRLKYNRFIHQKYSTVENYIATLPVDLKDKLGKSYQNYSLEIPATDSPDEVLFDLDGFLSLLEGEFWQGIGDVCREAGAKIPINYNNHTFTISGMKIRNGDFVGLHQYYGHPQWMRGKYSTTQTYNIVGDWHFNRKPHLNYMGAITGLPLHLGESNSSNPNFTRDSIFPMWTAYASLHGWDAVSWFAPFASGKIEGKKLGTCNPFGYSMDPSRVLPIQICGLAFLRGDFAQAKNTYNILLNDKMFIRNKLHNNLYGSRKIEFYQNGTYPWPLVDYEAFSALAMISRITTSINHTEENNGIPVNPSFDTQIKNAIQGTNYLSLRETFLTDVAERSNQNVEDVLQGKVFTSDTGQIIWDRKKGNFIGSSPKTIFISGCLNNQAEHIGVVTMSVKSKYGTIVITSLDNRSIESSKHLLLLRIGDSGEKGDHNRIQGHWLDHPEEPAYIFAGVGIPPVYVDPVIGTLKIKFKTPSSSIQVRALCNNGRLLQTLSHEIKDKILTFELTKDVNSLYYEIVRK